MELKGTIQTASYAPRFGTDPTIVLDVMLDDINEVATVKETNNEATLIKKYDFKVENQNQYDLSAIEGRRCLIFRNNEGDSFIDYL